MSRSYKKNPVYTDGHRRSTKITKQLANRSVRRRNKQIVNGYFYEDNRFRDELTLDGRSYKKWFCSYDIHDYVSRWSKLEAINDYEHPQWNFDFWSHSWWNIWSEYETVEAFLNYWEKYYKRK